MEGGPGPTSFNVQRRRLGTQLLLKLFTLHPFAPPPTKPDHPIARDLHLNRIAASSPKNNGDQIRVYKVPQGGPLPLLPDLGAQRRHEVSPLTVPMLHPQYFFLPRDWTPNRSQASQWSAACRCGEDSSDRASIDIDSKANPRACNPSRAFLTKSYPTMKKHNPSIPIMLREANGTLPKVYARYEFGQEKSQSLEGKPNTPLHTEYRQQQKKKRDDRKEGKRDKAAPSKKGGRGEEFADSSFLSSLQVSATNKSRTQSRVWCNSQVHESFPGDAKARRKNWSLWETAMLWPLIGLQEKK